MDLRFYYLQLKIQKTILCNYYFELSEIVAVKCLTLKSGGPKMIEAKRGV